MTKVEQRIRRNDVLPTQRRSSMKCLLIAVFVLMTSGSLNIASAQEPGRPDIVICNGCQIPRQAAINTQSSGLKLVVDFNMAKLYAFQVEYDWEMRRWLAFPQQIPVPITEAFHRVMDATAARSIEQSRQAAPTHDATKNGGPLVNLHPDNPGGSNNIRFPEAYKNFNAYDIVDSSSSRSRLGQNLALELAGATGSNPNWNTIALSLQRAVLTFASIYGGGTITLRITWRDGSTTLYSITAANVAEASYVPGQSRDASGNMVPDQSIAVPATAPAYAGAYYFGPSGDRARWTRSAAYFGVPVSGGSSSGHRMSCDWDGSTVTCKAM